MNPDNRVIWDGQRKGWLESWYFIIHDRKTGTAFWLRYTLVSPKDGPAFAGLWAFEFRPGEAPVAAREIFAEGEFRADPFKHDIHIGPGRMTDEAVSARLRGETLAAWNLSFKPYPVTYFAAPPLFRAFSSSHFSIPTPRTKFTGTISIAGRTYSLDGAPGCQGHFATPGLGKGWTWAHATEFEEGAGFAEAVAPGPGLVASVGVAWGGRTWPGNTLGALAGGRLEGSDWKRTFRAETSEGPVTWEIEGSPAQAIGVEYSDPTGQKLYCYNTLLASSVIRCGAVSLRSKGTTVLEISSELPRLDVPVALRAAVAPVPRGGGGHH
ncbi:MAG: hypothetical protein K8T20_17365 [Planctomycetes bacterium]|nr:hypothetical protein [Planctomycetota bacterium]